MKAFPILYQGTTRLDHWPIAVEWEDISYYEHVIKSNHGQSLKAIAERGGLSPVELFMAMKGLHLGDRASRPLNDTRAIELMIEWPVAWIYGQNKKTG